MFPTISWRKSKPTNWENQVIAGRIGEEPMSLLSQHIIGFIVRGTSLKSISDRDFGGKNAREWAADEQAWMVSVWILHRSKLRLVIFVNSLAILFDLTRNDVLFMAEFRSIKDLFLPMNGRQTTQSIHIRPYTYREVCRILEFVWDMEKIRGFSEHWTFLDNSRLFEKTWIFSNQLECSRNNMRYENYSMVILLADFLFLSCSIRYADKNPDLVHECTAVLIVLEPEPQTRNAHRNYHRQSDGGLNGWSSSEVRWFFF
jgi:hypothetical protein